MVYIYFGRIAGFQVMLCLLVQQCLAYDSWLWSGDYMVNLTWPNGSMIAETGVMKLHHELFSSQNYNHTKGLGMEASFTGNRYIPHQNIGMYGNCTENYDSCFFYIINADITLSGLLRNMNKCLTNATLAESMWLHRCLQTAYTRINPGLYIVSIGFSMQADSNASHTSMFLLKERATGTLRKGYDDSFSFSLYRFDREKYVAEGKIFGLYVAISIIFSRIAWKSISENFTTDTQLDHLCIHSLALHLGWEFAFGMFVLTLSSYDIHFAGFYCLLFCISVVVYFTTEVPFIVSVWKYVIREEDHPDRAAMRFTFFTLFTELLVILSVIGQAANMVFDYPYICVTILYSWFIPQIVRSARSPSRKRNDTIFVLTTGISRLLTAYYFTLYRNNITQSYSVNVAVYVTVYVTIQIVIVLLQNKLGGAFFLPVNWRPVRFDYSMNPPAPGTECSICLCEIEEGEESMTTPCRHAFHRECLMRWISERHICPLCRHRLPVLEEEL